MYILDEFLDDALTKVGQTWTTPAHRVVAEKVLLCNPTVTMMDQLMDGVKKINSIPEDRIKKTTLDDLRALNVPGFYP